MSSRLPIPDHQPLFPNVYEALQAASTQSKREESNMEVVSTRLYPIDNERLESICKENGTTRSEFLRQCALLLIEDYGTNPIK